LLTRDDSPDHGGQPLFTLRPSGTDADYFRIINLRIMNVSVHIVEELDEPATKADGVDGSRHGI